MIKKNKPIISAIVAMGENRVIGKDNQMPWHLPADLKHFKDITTGHPIIMGRKTFASIGKALSNRTNIILSRNKNLTLPDCIVVSSLEEAIDVAQKENSAEIFIIGGAEIFSQLLPEIEKIYLTIVHQTFQGDAYFPEINKKEWHEMSREDHPADEKNLYDYSFIVLEKN